MQFKAQEKEAMMQERYDIYSFKTSLFDTYKRRKKNNVIVPIFKQYQKEMLTILLPDIKVDYLDFLIKNNISSVYITFSGIRVTRFVNIFFNYNFPEYVVHPRLECHEEEILDRLIELDKFIRSKNIKKSYEESVRYHGVFIIEFKDWYHKKIVLETLLNYPNAEKNLEFIEKNYSDVIPRCQNIQISMIDERYSLNCSNPQTSSDIKVPCNILLEQLRLLDNFFKENSQSLPKLNIPLIVSFNSDNQIEDKSTLEVPLSKKKKKDDIQLDTIEKIIDNITPFNTKHIIRTFNEKYKIVLHDIEVAAVNQEPTGLNLLKEFYLYDNQLKTIFETYLPDTKWNGKFDEDSIKLLDTIPLLSNLIRYCSIDKFKPNLVFGMVDGIKFINRNLLTTYLKEHCSREDLYVLIKARKINPAIVKEIGINYYYSDYFKDVFTYFDIDYKYAYPSFFRFMINFIMQEEVVE